MHANTDNHANVYVCCFLFFLDLLISLDIVLLPRSSSSHTLGSASVFPSTGMGQILPMHKINIDLVWSTPVAPLLLQCLCRLCYFQYFFLTHFTPTPPPVPPPSVPSEVGDWMAWFLNCTRLSDWSEGFVPVPHFRSQTLWPEEEGGGRNPC